MTARTYQRVLVVADWTVDERAATAAVKARHAEDGAVFSVVVPAWLHGLDWIGDPTARRPRAQAQVDKLEHLWAHAQLPVVFAEVGDPDPVSAVVDALAKWPADEIVLLARHARTIARRIGRVTGLPTRRVGIGLAPANERELQREVELVAPGRLRRT
jgi:hypothetical protein